MIASFAKAAAQLAEPRMLRVLLLGIAATLVLYVILYVAVAWTLANIHLFSWHWLDSIADILGGAAVFILTLLLFPAVATTVLSFLSERICLAVEDRFYPGLGAPRAQGVGELAFQALRFALIALLVNIVALPIYIPLAIFLGLGAALYYVVNGYLLARAYFELVAWRRLEPRQGDALRRAHLGRLWLAGIALAIVSTVPFLNLIAPVLGTAAFVHEFESLRQRERLV